MADLHPGGPWPPRMGMGPSISYDLLGAEMGAIRGRDFGSRGSAVRRRTSIFLLGRCCAKVLTYAPVFIRTQPQALSLCTNRARN